MTVKVDALAGVGARCRTHIRSGGACVTTATKRIQRGQKLACNGNGQWPTLGQHNLYTDKADNFKQKSEETWSIVHEVRNNGLSAILKKRNAN